MMLKLLMALAFALTVIASALGCEDPVEVHDFDGCFRNGAYDYQCENADGLWKCAHNMDRASCVWMGPLPVGHPLQRNVERLASFRAVGH
jgi:hypothetical protein